MAGRFIIQKVSSGMSRSTSRLGSQVSTSVSAGAPVTRTAPPESYFNTFACTRVEAKTRWPVKRPFSSTAVKKHGVSSEAKKAPQDTSMTKRFAELNKSANTTMALSACIGIGFMCVVVSSSPHPDDSTRCCNCHCHSPKPEVEQK